jgi:hypothetical protein
MHAARTVLGQDKPGAQAYFILPGTGRLVVDPQCFTFEGNDMKEGYIRADARTSAVKSFFINIHRFSLGKVIAGFVLLIAGAVLAVATILFLFTIAIGVGCIIAGIVLLVKGYSRGIEFSVLITENLFTFVTIKMQSLIAGQGFKEFLQAFWSMTRDVELEGLPQVTMSIPIQQPGPVLPGVTARPRPAEPDPRATGFQRPAEPPVKTTTVPSPPATMAANPPGTMPNRTIKIIPKAQVDNLELAFPDINPDHADLKCPICSESFRTADVLLDHQRETNHW